MSTKTDLRRIRMSLERERARLKAEAVQFDRDRRAMQRERESAILALRELCAQFGDNDWGDDEPLARIVERLKVHLVRQVTDLRALRAASGAPVPPALPPSRSAPPPTDEPLPRVAWRAPAPEPLRPSPVPRVVHRCLIVDAEYAGGMGKRATCMCGWRSAGQPDERGAILAGEIHVERFDDERGRADAHA